jgi:1,4-dihydroxy-2-naphthoate octaprenyltransferase
MKRAVIIFSILSLLSGLALIYFAFEGKELIYALIFFGLGIFAIGSAIAYTVGKSAYGYRGLGDLFVLIFFGLIGVMGSFFLQRQALPMVMFFPAIGMGLLSTGVLNLNNMRDMEADERAGKRTLAVLMGRANARVYHLFLLGTALACFAIFTIMETVGILPWLWLIATPLILLNGVKATTIKEPSKLDPLLKQLALSTTLLVICFGIGILA